MKLAALQLFGDAQIEEFALVADSNATSEALKFVSNNNMQTVLEHLKANDQNQNNKNEKQENDQQQDISTDTS